MSRNSELFELFLPKTFDCPFCLSFLEVIFFFFTFFPPPVPPVYSCLPVWQVLGNVVICLLQRLGPKHVGEGRLFGRLKFSSADSPFARLFIYYSFQFPELVAQTFLLACSGSSRSGRGGSAVGFPFRSSALCSIWPL